MRWLNLLAVGFVAIAGHAIAATQPEADAAYARGDYATAFKIWLPLAEQGSAYAAQRIAGMYERGEWVAEDRAMANEWYRKAAAFQAYDASMAPPDPAQAIASAQPVGTQIMSQPVVPQPVVTQPVVTQPVIITQTVTRPVVTRQVFYTVPVYYPPRPVYVPRPAPPSPSHHTHHHSRRH